MRWKVNHFRKVLASAGFCRAFHFGGSGAVGKEMAGHRVKRAGHNHAESRIQMIAKAMIFEFSV
jgi:hypothetical protein